MRTRILVDILFFATVFMLPPWLIMPAGIVCLFVFENFYEIIIAGIILDGLYGVPTRFFFVPAIYTLSASILFIIRTLLSKHLKFYV